MNNGEKKNFGGIVEDFLKDYDRKNLKRVINAIDFEISEEANANVIKGLEKAKKIIAGFIEMNLS